jgi:hypothetical protein
MKFLALASGSCSLIFTLFLGCFSFLLFLSNPPSSLYCSSHFLLLLTLPRHQQVEITLVRRTRPSYRQILSPSDFDFRLLVPVDRHDQFSSGVSHYVFRSHTDEFHHDMVRCINHGIFAFSSISHPAEIRLLFFHERRQSTSTPIRYLVFQGEVP